MTMILQSDPMIMTMFIYYSRTDDNDCLYITVGPDDNDCLFITVGPDDNDCLYITVGPDDNDYVYILQ